jgi:hypothetical protein
MRQIFNKNAFQNSFGRRKGNRRWAPAASSVFSSAAAVSRCERAEGSVYLESHAKQMPPITGADTGRAKIPHSHRLAASHYASASVDASVRTPHIHHFVPGSWTGGRPKSAFFFGANPLSGRAVVSNHSDIHQLWEDTVPAKSPPKAGKLGKARKFESWSKANSDEYEREQISRRLAVRLQNQGGHGIGNDGSVGAVELLQQQQEEQQQQLPAGAGGVAPTAIKWGPGTKHVPQNEQAPAKIPGDSAADLIHGSARHLALTVTEALSDAISAFNTFRQSTARAWRGPGASKVETMTPHRNLAMLPSSLATAEEVKEREESDAAASLHGTSRFLHAAGHSSSRHSPSRLGSGSISCRTAPGVEAHLERLARGQSSCRTPPSADFATTRKSMKERRQALREKSKSHRIVALQPSASSAAPATDDEATATGDVGSKLPLSPMSTQRVRTNRSASDAGFVCTVTEGEKARKAAERKAAEEAALAVVKTARDDGSGGAALPQVEDSESMQQTVEMLLKDEAAREAAARLPSDGATASPLVLSTSKVKQGAAKPIKESETMGELSHRRYPYRNVDPYGAFLKNGTQFGVTTAPRPDKALGDVSYRGGAASERGSDAGEEKEAWVLNADKLWVKPWGRNYTSPPGRLPEKHVRNRVLIDYRNGAISCDRPDWTAAQLPEPWC